MKNKKKEETNYLPKIDTEKERIDQRRNFAFFAFAGLTRALCASGWGRASRKSIESLLSSIRKKKG